MPDQGLELREIVLWIQTTLILNNRGNLLGFYFTPGGVDHHGIVLLIAKGFFEDHGSLSNKLFELLWVQGVKLTTKLRNNIEPRFLIIDRILLRKRTLIETVNDQLKGIYQIKRARHRSRINTFVHLLAGLTAYT